MGKRIVFAGEVMGELRHQRTGDASRFSVGFAGDTFNAAVYCKRSLSTGAEVFYQTRIGHDPLSYGALGLAKKEGLDCSFVRHDDTQNLGPLCC